MKKGSPYVSLGRHYRGASKRRISVRDALIFHLDRDGGLIGIEVLKPERARPFASVDALRSLQKEGIGVQIRSR
jgi:hypothetical protein